MLRPGCPCTGVSFAVGERTGAVPWCPPIPEAPRDTAPFATSRTRSGPVKCHSHSSTDWKPSILVLAVAMLLTHDGNV